MRLYGHTATIRPRDFDKIYSVNISQIGYHFMDDSDYSCLNIIAIDGAPVRSRCLTYNSDYAITIQRQYLFLYTTVDYDYPWFKELIKLFDNEYRKIIRFRYDKYTDQLFVNRNYITDKYIAYAVNAFIKHIEVLGIVNLETLFFIQVSKVCE